MESVEKIDYWDCDQCTERLYYEDKDEAIEAYLDQLDHGINEEIYLYGFKNKEVNRKQFEKIVLEYSEDYLIENYDSEDGHTQNEEIKKAASIFVDSYLENYKSGQCDLVLKEKFNVKEWCVLNRPDFLESISFIDKGNNDE